MNRLGLLWVFCVGLFFVSDSLYAMHTATTVVFPQQQFEFVRSVERQALVFTCASAVCFGVYASGYSEAFVLTVGGITLTASVLQTVISCVFRRRLVVG